MAHIEDRWMKPGPTGRKIKSDRYGTGKRWQAVWHEPDGTRRRKSFTTKDEAEAALADIRVSQLAGSYIAPDRSRVTVRDVAEEWFAAQVHQRSSSLAVIRQRLDGSILPALGHLRLEQIDRAAIQRAVTVWATESAATTTRQSYKYASAIFRHAVDERRIPRTPCTRINLPALSAEAVVPLTVDEVQAVVERLWVPYKALGVLISATGLRGGEARGLSWDRITPKGSGAILTIDRQLATTEPTWGPLKTAASRRSLSIGPATLQALGERGDGLVFRNAQGRPMSRQNLSEAWRHVMPALGRSGWHDLRHHHASMLIAGGASVIAVARRLGHKDPTETLRTYGHLWHDDEERMVAATDGLVMLAAPAQPPTRQRRRSAA